ncbi:sulfate transporter [Idiomarina seosinensis]|uniref:Sulfate transporter n=2 Tax=Idiomarina seosinensis TaxID=281739 RepID=A0A432ZE97_9GAMM|nr:sulfate transporter [Idiomarina seosinensis]
MSESKVDFELQQDGVLRLQGELTRSSIPAIWRRWQREVLTQSITKVDVSNVESVDTAGVALLLEIVKAGEAQTLDCLGANQQLKQIAAVSGVEGVLSLS